MQKNSHLQIEKQLNNSDFNNNIKNKLTLRMIINYDSTVAPHCVTRIEALNKPQVESAFDCVFLRLNLPIEKSSMADCMGVAVLVGQRFNPVQSVAHLIEARRDGYPKTQGNQS